MVNFVKPSLEMVIWNVHGLTVPIGRGIINLKLFLGRSQKKIRKVLVMVE